MKFSKNFFGFIFSVLITLLLLPISKGWSCPNDLSQYYDAQTEKISKKNWGLKNHKGAWITKGWDSIEESQNNPSWFWVRKSTRSHPRRGIVVTEDEYGWIEICYDEEHDSNFQWNWAKRYECRDESDNGSGREK